VGKVWWSSRDAKVFVVDENGTVTAPGGGVSHVLAGNATWTDNPLVRVHQVASSLEAFGEGKRAAPRLSLLHPVGVRVLDAGEPLCRLTMPFAVFHDMVEKLLGRAVWTHEFARPEHLIAEFAGWKDSPESPLLSLKEISGRSGATRSEPGE